MGRGPGASRRGCAQPGAATGTGARRGARRGGRARRGYRGRRGGARACSHREVGSRAAGVEEEGGDDGVEEAARRRGPGRRGLQAAMGDGVGEEDGGAGDGFGRRVAAPGASGTCTGAASGGFGLLPISIQNWIGGGGESEWGGAARVSGWGSGDKGVGGPAGHVRGPRTNGGRPFLFLFLLFYFVYYSFSVFYFILAPHLF